MSMPDKQHEEWRVDSFELRAPPTRTPEGFLRVSAISASAGVLVYVDPRTGKEIHELVPPEVLASEGNLTTLDTSPCTCEHPPTGYVDTGNASQYVKGATLPGSTYEAANEVNHTEHVVYDGATIDAILSGEKAQVSPGYLATIERTPGVHPKYGRYDQIQVARRNNHVAFTGSPRNPNTMLKLDSNDADTRPWGVFVRRLDSLTTHTGEAPMSTSNTLKFDIGNGVSVDVEQSVGMAILAIRNDAEGKVEAAMKALAEAREELDGMRAERDALTERIDAVEAQLSEAMGGGGGGEEVVINDADGEYDGEGDGGEGDDELNMDGMDGMEEDMLRVDSKEFNAYVAERTELEALAKSFDVDTKELATNHDFRVALVEEMGGGDLRNDSADVVAGVFKALKSTHDAARGSYTPSGEEDDKDNEENRLDSMSATEKFHQRLLNRDYKNKATR